MIQNAQMTKLALAGNAKIHAYSQPVVPMQFAPLGSIEPFARVIQVIKEIHTPGVNLMSVSLILIVQTI